MSYLSRLPVRVRDAFSARPSGRHRHAAGPTVRRVSMARVMCLDVVAGRERRCARRGLLRPAESQMSRPEARGEYFPPLAWEEPGTLVRPYIGCPTGPLNGGHGVREVAR